MCKEGFDYGYNFTALNNNEPVISKCSAENVAVTRIFFVIDQLDVVLLNEAGMLLTTVDRSFGIDVEDEPDTEIDTDVVAGTDRTSEADVDTTPEQDEIKTETSIFEMIINFIKSIFELLFTFIPVSYK